jgi:stage II sporulation protein D
MTPSGWKIIEKDCNSIVHNRPVINFQILTALLIVLSCTSQPFIRPNPPSSQKNGSDARKQVRRRELIENLDFADAFDTLKVIDTTLPVVPPTSVSSSERKHDTRNGATTFLVPTKKVRIALVRNTHRAVAYSVGAVSVRSHRQRESITFRGRILFEKVKGKSGITVTGMKEYCETTLPCTLRCGNAYNFIEFDEATYRGALIIAPGKEGTFTVVNYLDVEDYLRGVVPLEMGKRPKEEIEALKAQAVAARTYTYRRIVERSGEPYDMVKTVTDQVYGGVGAENRESDQAIRATGNLIMVYRDSIIYAYYHSTCGGKTANINDVWNKPSRSYLRSIADVDKSGNAYCRISKYFTWEEYWPWRQFSNIVKESFQKKYPGNRLRGVATGIQVEKRYACGRIRQAMITGSGWAHECGGDEIRFILRRGVSGYPILRSANFTVVSSDKNVIKLKGRGYGHGVGMCQMGAVGRAQAGQDFQTILRVYYRGVTIVTAVTGRTETP